MFLRAVWLAAWCLMPLRSGAGAETELIVPLARAKCVGV
jgi:hypothetical protein